MIALLVAQGCFLTILFVNWAVWIFDNVTGVILLHQGQIATFVQTTRSQNALMILLLMISGRTIGDCLFIAVSSFLLPWYINGTTTMSFYLSVCVFFELYFEKNCNALALRYPNSVWTLTTGVRVWLIWILSEASSKKSTIINHEEIFNRFIELNSKSN